MPRRGMVSLCAVALAAGVLGASARAVPAATTGGSDDCQPPSCQIIVITMQPQLNSRQLKAARLARAEVRETKGLHALMGRLRPAGYYRVDMLHPEHSWVVWDARLVQAQQQFRHPPHEAQWSCIHHFEGSWTDTGAPYYGGLQMDWNFMSSYGRRLLRAKGPAYNWTPLEQMWVAEAAWRAGRGFYPWPNTARMCGLI